MFQLDGREGSVVFGDGVHGVQPEAGLLVEALELARSSFGGGNVLRGQVNRLETPVEGVTAENLEDADAFVALTGRDEDNLIISLYAMQRKVAKVVAKCNRQNYTGIVRDPVSYTHLGLKGPAHDHIHRAPQL